MKAIPGIGATVKTYPALSQIVAPETIPLPIAAPRIYSFCLMSHSSTDGRAKSFFECEPPNLCIWRLHGDVDEDDIERLCALQAQFYAGKPYVFVLLDLRAMKSVSPQARKSAVKDRGDMVVKATAAFGGSFALRTLAALVSKAFTLFFPKREQNFRAFESEEEARAWLSRLAQP